MRIADGQKIQNIFIDGLHLFVPVEFLFQNQFGRFRARFFDAYGKTGLKAADQNASSASEFPKDARRMSE